MTDQRVSAAPVKLWLDDHRKPPLEGGWYWALDTEDAKQFLRENQVTEQSLDHDLDGSSDGLTLLVWEHDHRLVPYMTRVHTWNEIGATRMGAFLKDHRYQHEVQPDPRPPGQEEP